MGSQRKRVVALHRSWERAKFTKIAAEPHWRVFGREGGKTAQGSSAATAAVAGISLGATSRRRPTRTSSLDLSLVWNR